MPIVVESRRKSLVTLNKLYPGAEVLDVTSKGPDPWIRFSPFFPHGGIPIPNTPRMTAQSVEGVWQGLKVFETEGVDASKLSNRSMHDLKRTQRRFGSVKGHQHGLLSRQLLSYKDARRDIYLPTYHWILENKLQLEIELLRTLAQTKTVVLLDYTTNGNWEDTSEPLSHAALVKLFAEGHWPVASA